VTAQYLDDRTPKAFGLYAGDRAPKAYQLELVPLDDGVDFTIVTAWALYVRLDDGTFKVWDVTATDVTPTTATLTHVFAVDASDLPRSGSYDIFALLTVPGGFLRSDPVTEYVGDPYGMRV
jgi:hypothetical protein